MWSAYLARRINKAFEGLIQENIEKGQNQWFLK
jgi:hypothetical protein